MPDGCQEGLHSGSAKYSLTAAQLGPLFLQRGCYDTEQN